MKQCVGLGFVLTLVLTACAQNERTVNEMRDEARTELGIKFNYEVVEDLFVIASNADAKITTRGINTVRHVYSALYDEFMTTRPKDPIKVYLFADKDSYDIYCKKAYPKPPSTPFGFYMPGDRKMVMNIATGTGTLAHELVHPMIEADFPSAPTWFNEGFASLFEQSKFLESGHIRGLTNWRLPNLQRAIKNGECPGLKALLSTSRDQFYDSATSGLNYAMARYLCYYLQEHDLLEPFYKTFRNAKDDKTGIATLERLSKKKLAEFEKPWRDWVATLNFE